LTQAALAEELGTVREVIVRGLATLRGRYSVQDLTALGRLADD
jgi:hypothetical protein